LRDYKLYLHDIIEAVDKIETFTKGFTFEEFAEDAKTVDAVISDSRSVFGLRYRHRSKSLKQFWQQALPVIARVLDHDKCHPGPPRHRFEKLVEGFNATGGSPNSNDGEAGFLPRRYFVGNSLFFLNSRLRRSFFRFQSFFIHQGVIL
jgi:hypothetical protein